MAGRVFSDDDFADDAGPSPRFDMRTGKAPALDPLEAAIQRRAAQQPKAAEGPDFVESGIRGAAQGFTGMHADELAGSSATYGVGGFGLPGMSLSGVRSAAIERERAGDPTGTKTYEATTDASRGRDAQAAENHPAGYYPGLIGASILARGPKFGATTGLGRVAAAGAKGTIEGAAYGEGASEADDLQGILRDTGAGAGLGGALGVAGATVGEGVKAGGKYIANNLKNRILNEVGEGVSGSQVTSTQRKFLDKSKDAIFEEMTTGPDAKTVRSTRYGPAAKGREKLAPVLDDIGQKLESQYQKFEEAGRSAVPAEPFLTRIESQAAEAVQAGDTMVADGLRVYAKRVAAAAEEGGGQLNLQQLRGMTTEAQGIAASAIDGLKGGANAQKLKAVAGAALDALNDTVDTAAAGSDELTEAAGAIRANNRRYSANKRVDEMLEMRASKENTGPGTLVRVAKAATNPGTLAIGGALATGEDDRAEGLIGGLALGAGLRGLVPMARLAQRGITSAGIHSQLPGGLVGPAARGVGRATRPFVPPLSMNILDALMKRRQQENE